jgi:hypothetical protein
VRTSLPSGRKETIVADHLDVGAQWSQAEEMPMTSRPSDVTTIPLFQRWPSGSRRIVRRAAKRVPRSPLKASTRPIEAT